MTCIFVCENSVEAEPGGKCCKVSWFRTVTHFRICNVIFVLLTALAMVIVMYKEQCANEHHSGTACASYWALWYEFLAR